MTDLSSLFYTHIPHILKGRKITDFTIDTNEKLKEKMDMVQSLIDIKIAHTINKKSGEMGGTAGSKNVIDENYAKLNCDLTTLGRASDEFKMIDQYLQNSRGGFKVELMDAFKIYREGDHTRYNPLNLGNKKLLWHGSRFSNFVGILSQGLRIAPPEVPKTGYNFGKGVYLADMAGKSGYYTCYSVSNNVGLFLLCEAALGKLKEYNSFHQDADIVPAGFDSTHGVGYNIPDPAKSIVIDNDITVPNGPVVNYPAGGLGNNEFVVYNVN